MDREKIKLLQVGDEMNLLEIRNLKKSFGDLEVIKGISLNVEEGKVVSILVLLALESLPFLGVLLCWRL